MNYKFLSTTCIAAMLIPLQACSLNINTEIPASSTQVRSNSIVTLECQNQTMNFFESNRKITLKGTCKDIEIFGSNNIFQIENADSAEVFGSNNILHLNTAPKIEIFGSNNITHVQRTDSIEVYGSNSKVHYGQSLDPNKTVKIEIYGAKSSVKQQSR